MSSYHLTVSTPDGTVYDDMVEGLIVRGALGDLAVLAGHIPMVTTVRACDCRILLPDDRELSAHTEGGLLTVSKEGTTLLCSSFLLGEES